MMEAVSPTEYERAGMPRLKERRRFTQRWDGRLLLCIASIALLILSYAPISQCYLAWIGLVPWLVVVGRCRSYRGAALWGWVGGLLFFTGNMWWMAYVTFLGMLGLMAILAAYWAVMGLTVYHLWGKPARDGGDGPLDTPRPLVGSVWIVPLAWTGLEFIRGNFIWKGLPWLYLGHTQTPLLVLCQLADITGVYGLSFWIVLINATIAAAYLNGWRWSSVRGPIIATAVLTVFIVGYGIFRIKQTTLTEGPTVMVVQPNYPQSNDGQKGATADEIVDFHVKATRNALLEHPDTDLVVWSETEMPEMNAEARMVLKGADSGFAIEATVHVLQNLCATFSAGLITGGRFEGEWKPDGQYIRPLDSRNAAYFFERSGLMSDLRYDKIHIVPFGEFIPFRDTIPWLYRLMIRLGPPDMEFYQLQAGDEDSLTVFPLRRTRDPLDLNTWRFVTPICFEDIDAGLCAKMFRPGTDGQKRADVLINLTNDGWFKANENSQHLQAAVFRSIENRVPSARSVNTGVSGFIDSVGHVHDLLPARTTGVSTAKLMLDPRVTFYTVWGDAFAWACVSIAVTAMILKSLARR